MASPIANLQVYVGKNLDETKAELEGLGKFIDLNFILVQLSFLIL